MARSSVCCGARARLALVAALVVILAAASPPPEVVVSGKLLYGSGQNARRAAVVDIVTVYNSNPAYKRMKDHGLKETDPRGKVLFDQAQKWSNKALAEVARDHKIDVITIPGGVQGGEAPVSDLTQPVIAQLPRFCVEGKVVHGQVQGASAVAELDSQAVLSSIREYVECQSLDESDARYHLLRKKYQDLFANALRRTVLKRGLDVVVEKGGVTTREGAALDITPAVVAALSS